MSASPRSVPGEATARHPRLADPRVISSLSAFVRARVPPGEAEDIVQAVLAEALAAPRPPADDDEVRAWLHGIARHKIVDCFRRARRERPHDPRFSDAAPACDASHGARDLMRWARRELPGGDEDARTFEWMLREGEGEKLAAIAADAEVPAPRVRQRVSRLRKHYRARRAAEIAALALLLGIAVALVLVLGRDRDRIAPRPTPQETPTPSAQPSLPLPLPPAPPPALPAASAPEAGLREAPAAPTASAGQPTATGKAITAPTAAPPLRRKPTKAHPGGSLGTSDVDSPPAPSAATPIK